MTEPFVAIPKAILARTDLTAADKLVFGVIRDRMREKGCCWPGERQIAKDAGLARSTVQTSIAHLEAKGDLHVERRPWPESNCYSLPDPDRTENRSAPKIGPDQKSGTCVPKIGPSAYRKSVQKKTDEVKRGSTARRAPSAVTWNPGQGCFEVDPDTLTRWQRDYRHLDIGRELVKAANWQAVNRPKKDHARFLVNWLNNARPDGNPRAAGGAKAGRPEPTLTTWSTARKEPAVIVPREELDRTAAKLRASDD